MKKFKIIILLLLLSLVTSCDAIRLEVHSHPAPYYNTYHEYYSYSDYNRNRMLGKYYYRDYYQYSRKHVYRSPQRKVKRNSPPVRVRRRTIRRIPTHNTAIRRTKSGVRKNKIN